MTLDLDLFCCSGGATTGLAMLGRSVVGVDHDPDACRTHLAAGHPTIRADLTAPAPVSGPFELVWASPPCTAFSMAGKGEGREVAGVLIGRILAEDWSPLDGYDAPVWLVLPTMAELLRLSPTAICMENVPPTLPVMHACAQVLERHGYHTAVGVLSAETFGVAQTRKRAFLLANRTRRVALPEPTHQMYGKESDEAQGSLFGEPLLPWMSMADALGWGSPERPVTTLTAGSNRQGGVDPLDGGSGARKTMRELADRESWVVRTDRPVAMDRRTISAGRGGARVPTVTVPVTSPSPSPSLTSSGVKGQFVWVLRTNNGNPVDGYHSTESDKSAPTLNTIGRSWGWERPSTTLVSSFRPDVVAGPGYRQAGDGPRQDAPGSISISISISEAARLQAFPNGHPWRGSRTSIFRQVGNAVPPPVAAAVAGAALGIDWRPAVDAYLTELYRQPLEREQAA